MPEQHQDLHLRLSEDWKCLSCGTVAEGHSLHRDGAFVAPVYTCSDRTCAGFCLPVANPLGAEERITLILEAYQLYRHASARLVNAVEQLLQPGDPIDWQIDRGEQTYSQFGTVVRVTNGFNIHSLAVVARNHKTGKTRRFNGLELLWSWWKRK